MRKATFAKLSLTAMVGLGTLVGQATMAQAGPPQTNGGVIIAQPTTTTTIKPIPADPVGPCGQIDCDQADEVDPDPPFDPDLPIAQPEADDCDQPSCDKAPVPQPDPDPECNPHVLCDEITSDPGCTWTHGCPQPDPECPEIALCDEITSDPGCTLTHGDCGGGDEGTDGGDEGTDGTTGGDDGTDGTTGGGQGTDGGGHDSLPRTGAEMATWAIAGLGLTGVGAALRKLGKRAA